MEYIIGGILIIITLLILGLILRKRVYDRVDKLEEWKLAVMNRDVTDQLSKLKDLNLSGETQNRFEAWRAEWDHILTRTLPDIEEELFDAEEAADRFLFRKASKITKNIAKTIEKTEASINKIYEEVDRLIDTKEESTKILEQVRTQVKEMRRHLIQNRYLYGKAEVVFEVELDDIEEQISAFEDLTNEGNYSDAENLVIEANERLAILNEKINALPVLYHSCKTDLPEQLDRLATGLIEMKESGHRIHHFGFEKEIHKYHEQLLLMLELLEQGEINGVEDTVHEIESRIQEIYDKLEEEALAKSFTEKQMPLMFRNLEEIEKDLQKTKEEVKILKESYHFDEEDEETQLSLDNFLKQLKVNGDKIKMELEEDKKNYTYLRIELEEWMEEWQKMYDTHQIFKQRINSLRQEELQAKEKIDQLALDLSNIRRKLQKSNLPGIPSYILDMVHDVGDIIGQANEKLQKHPLNMEEINTLLYKAEKNTSSAKEQMEYLFEQAQFAEYIIQYSNRYRSQYPVLAAKLLEAENAFRNWEYEQAIEIAANALEAVEAGAVQRLEENLKNHKNYA